MAVCVVCAWGGCGWVGRWCRGEGGGGWGRGGGMT